MKFKFHWGWAIGVFYTSFVAAMVYFVIYSKGVDHSLVRDNYYDYDIGYEKLIGEKRRNSNALKTPVAIEYDKVNENLAIIFPPDIKNVTGQIWLYRVNNEKLDKKINIKTDSAGKQIINFDNFAGGKWKVNIDWAAGGKQYLDHKDIYVK